MILHIPGPMVGLVQLCSRCGEVLGDYRNASVAVRPGHPEDAVIRGWEEGHPILRSLGGGYTSRVEDVEAALAEYPLCTEQVRQ